jgi:hypothetical protein
MPRCDNCRAAADKIWERKDIPKKMQTADSQKQIDGRRYHERDLNPAEFGAKSSLLIANSRQYDADNTT